MGEALPQGELLPSETSVLETLAFANTSWTQRKLAHRTGYSIGLINTILKKLSKTGYIKITSVNKQRLQYLLTPQGIATASKMACNYILRTFQDYQRFYLQISVFFKELSENGHRDLYVCCDDVELRELIQVVIRDSNFASGINFRSASAEGVTTVRLKGAAMTPFGPVLDLAIQPCEGAAS